MSNKLYVENLGYEVTSDRLRGMFAPYGVVRTAKVTTDRGTDRSRGFGFVEMATEQEALAAIAGMNGQPADGRTLAVSDANPKPNLPAEPSQRGGLGGAGHRREDRRGGPGGAPY